jgi:hypothetical protein
LRVTTLAAITQWRFNQPERSNGKKLKQYHGRYQRYFG